MEFFRLDGTSTPPDESEGYEGERLYCITPSGFGDWVNIRSIIVSAFQAFVFYNRISFSGFCVL